MTNHWNFSYIPPRILLLLVRSKDVSLRTAFSCREIKTKSNKKPAHSKLVYAVGKIVKWKANEVTQSMRIDAMNVLFLEKLGDCVN